MAYSEDNESKEVELADSFVRKLASIVMFNHANCTMRLPLYIELPTTEQQLADPSYGGARAAASG